VLKLNDSIKEIQSFWKDEPIFSNVGLPNKLELLEDEKKIQFPSELREYISNIIPHEGTCFETVGNPICLLSARDISWKMDGYNFNPVTNTPIDDWNDSWFLIADEGGDPIIIDLSENETTCNVYTAMHGAGEWDFDVISDSIGQFLACAAAVHTALTAYDIEDPIIDDENGFNLADEPAKFLFPYIRKTAPSYYSDWVSIFENS